MADQIRDTQIVKTPEVVIDPRFFVPDDVAGARVATPGELIPNDPDNDYLTGVDYDPVIVSDDGQNPGVDGDPGSGSVDGNNRLQTPQFVTVISQTVRTTADGTTVIDVVLGVEDIPGATNYEIRINAA